jgi:hypothetical protein
VGVFQQSKLMGDGRHGHTQHLGNVTDAHIRHLQDGQDAESGGIGKHAEQLRKMRLLFLRRELGLYLLHDMGVKLQTFAIVVSMGHFESPFI